MAGIGESLREARMRRRIDMTEVEAATKIRTKYLSALENEEWQLLPGPAYVKTFLRTYAEYLGLDAKLLVEEYRQRYERPSTGDLAPYTPVALRRDRRPRRPVLTPGVVIALGALALVGVLFAIGKLWPDQGGNGSSPPRTATSTPTATPTPRARRRAPARPTSVRLTIAATGTVNVCLLDARGRRLVPGRTLTAGETVGPFRARRFRVTFGNGLARMRVGRRSVDVPDRAQPIGFELRPGRRPRELPAASRPVCP